MCRLADGDRRILARSIQRNKGQYRAQSVPLHNLSCRSTLEQNFPHLLWLFSLIRSQRVDIS